MDIKRAFGIDERLKNEGFQYFFDDDAWVRLAYAGQSNFKYMTELQKQIEKHRSKLKRGKLAFEQDQKILIDVYIATIIKDWGNFFDNGENIPFSAENARKLFSDYPALFNEIVEEAQKIENFRAARDENEVNEIANDAKKS